MGATEMPREQLRRMVVHLKQPGSLKAEHDYLETSFQQLLSARKGACVNIIPKVSSQYWWQGKIEKADELMLVVKTRAALLDELITAVKQNHPYTVPEIIALPIIGGNPDYLA